MPPGAALWRSDNRGRTWRMIYPNPSKNTVEHQNGDHSDYSLTSSDKSYVSGLEIRQVVVDPGNSSTLHIAFADPQFGGTTVLVSRDAGTTFHNERSLPSDNLLLLAYPGGSLLAIDAQGVYRGRAGSPKPIAPGVSIIRAAAGTANGVTYLYATTSNGGVFVSEDAGLTWQNRTPALGQQSGRFGAVAAAANDGRVAYVGFRGLKLGDRPRRPLQRHRQNHRRGQNLVDRLPRIDPASRQPRRLMDRATRHSPTAQTATAASSSTPRTALPSPQTTPPSAMQPTSFAPTALSMAATPGPSSTPSACPTTNGPPAASTSPPPTASSLTHSTPGTSSSTTPTLASSPATTAAPPGNPQRTASRKNGATQPIGSPSTRR